MKAEKLLAALQNKKKTGNGWMALCPAHDDHNQSLSLKPVSDKILLKCFAGCSLEEIVSALGLKISDLFLTSDTKGNGHISTGGTRAITATYDYTDESGNLLYQTVRFEPKAFRQRRPDGNGGFIWNLRDTRLTLYRLPEILAAELIYFVEGEKDVETLRRHDLPATCSPLGAGNWRQEYAEFLRGKTVAILPDNDEAGRRHALDVARSLEEITRETVICEIPGLLPKEDVSDYFLKGGTADDLIELIARAPAFDKKTFQFQNEQNEQNEQAGQMEEISVPNMFTVKPANEWLTEASKRPIPRRLFGAFWFEGELCILFSDTNSGKSVLAVQIGESIASCRSIADFELETAPQTVLYTDFELSDKQFELRYSVSRPGEEFAFDHYQFSENFLRAEINISGEIPDAFKSIEEFANFSIKQLIAQTNASVLIVDNITYLAGETEKAKYALPLMKNLKRLKQQFDLSILAIAHTPKRDLTRPVTQNDLQGSKMLMNFADSSFAIGTSCENPQLRYIKQIKERNTSKIYGTENVAVCRIEKPRNFLQFQYLHQDRESKHLKQSTKKSREDLIEKAGELSKQGKTQREIAAELSKSVSTINSYLKNE